MTPQLELLFGNEDILRSADAIEIYFSLLKPIQHNFNFLKLVQIINDVSKSFHGKSVVVIFLTA